ncbi:MAG TPA: hypothetical protein VMD04_06485, partial [Candidatus Margulisiibacteriota bacterium]|nr:hypothetical protein [Candidatus Margulisiibacteriota bacterium]
MRFVQVNGKMRLLFASLFLFLFSVLYLLRVNRDVLGDTAFFGWDTSHYQPLGVNLSLGHGYKTGAIVDFAVYKFDKEPTGSVEFKGRGGFSPFHSHFLADTGYNFFRSPGYPLFLAAVYKICGIHPRVVKILQIILLSACAALMPVITVYYWPGHGLLSGVISAFIFTVFSAPDPAAIHTETLITFGLFILTLLIILWELKASTARTFFLGAAAALNILVKGTNAFLPPLLILYIFMRARGTRAKIKLPLTFILGFIICISPWSIYATKINRSPILSCTGGTVLLDGNNEDSLSTGGCEAAWHSWDAGNEKYLYNRLRGLRPFQKFLIFIKQNKNSMLGLLKNKLSSAFLHPFILLAVGGLFLYYLRALLFIRVKEGRKEKIPIFPLIYFANILLITLIFFGEPRYLEPFMPFFILPAIQLPFGFLELFVIPGRGAAKKQKLSILGACILLFLLSEWAARFILLKTNFLDRQTVKSDLWYFDRPTLRSNSWYRLNLIKRWQSEKGYPLAEYHYFGYNKLKGWALKPNLKDTAVPGGGILYTNSKGIRGKAEYGYTKPTDKTRILALGGSSTFGEGVGDTQTYPYYLQEMLPQAEVLNFGVKGYGHDQMLLYLKEEGIRY